MLATIRNYPRTVNLLLGATLLLTLAKAITFPYLVIYLSRHFTLDITQVGLVIGSSLIVGSLLSVYGGFLVDRVNSYRLLLALSALFVLGFVGTVLAHDIWLFYGCLILINLAYAVIDIAVKAGFASLLPFEARSEVFSIKYTLTNIGYAVGPAFGAVVAKGDISLPFIFSALLGGVFFLLYWRWGDRTLATVDVTQKPVSFLAVGRVLLRDHRLVCFTIGGLLSAVVYGQFTAWLSQYLVTTTTADYTYTVVSAVLTTNAVLVIALQYVIGRRISHRHLSRWLIAGLGMFMLGLVGFALSTSVGWWVLAMTVFTVGEIIVFPAEYMFIDRIAPDHLRGMYYGAQNLSNLGAALGPVLCGLVLASLPAYSMFYMLGAFIAVGGVFYFIGASLKANHPE
ncbi:MFS transporter [Pseudomonas tolaasii]|uniref:MFS transporter n=2 Tax=Pseudomonas tolaasii TaxID=29442 RepID=A0A7Y8AQZ4_PSETO|nr:MFS transporter [Pseudomonas tolaasii]ARB31348.1 MFS transporter [Pseudomonas tolaasii]KAB0465006.1 MFS transporter [Pseudomonas tolaasii]MBY8943913.1 MFS transporter [Pseudomonas tolaasii]NWC24647.1 MFS transporter [Pseudomonas tolaasii]NWC42444.1 MFS transporter [Pseudomonas tolaasii]